MSSHNPEDALHFGGLSNEIIGELLVEAYNEVALSDAEQLVFLHRVRLDEYMPGDKSLLGSKPIRKPEEIVPFLEAHYRTPIPVGYVVSVCDQVEMKVSQYIWNTINRVMAQHLGLIIS